MSLSQNLTQKPYFNDFTKFNKSHTGYWYSNFWQRALFCTPMWEGQGNQIIDLVSGLSYDTSISDLTATYTWTTALWGTGLIISNTVGSGGGGPAWPLPFASDADITCGWYGIAPNISAYSIINNGIFGIANLVLNDVNQILVDNTSTSSSNLSFQSTLNQAPQNTDVYLPSGIPQLITWEWVHSTHTANIYLNGILVNTINCPASVLDINSVVYIFFDDVDTSQFINGYTFVLNGLAGAAFHNKLAQDPIAPFVTYEPAALGEPINYTLNMRA